MSRRDVVRTPLSLPSATRHRPGPSMSAATFGYRAASRPPHRNEPAQRMSVALALPK